VVAAIKDPNRRFRAEVLKCLKTQELRLKSVLEEEAIRLNEIFITYIVKKKPFVILKTAMTLDGKIATASGDSKWVTGKKQEIMSM